MATDNQITAEDKVKVIELLTDLKVKVNEVTGHVQGQIKKVKSREWNSEQGVSFLELKNQMLLSYLINLTHLLCAKVKGRSICGLADLERLVEIRTVLEKMRPIDQKLKYQIDKVLKTAATGTLSDKDPLRFKANAGNLSNKLEGEDDEDESGSSGDEDKPKSSRVYRPPKLAPMHYDGDDTQEDKQDKQLERARKRARSTSVMRELRDEYHDGPQEIKDTADLHRAKVDRKGKEKMDYEEKYFTRITQSKKEKLATTQLRTMARLDDLTKFGDISALTEEGGTDAPPRKKQKTSSQQKGKRGKRTKKRKIRRQ